MRIGGTPWDSEIEMAVVGCILTVLSTLLSIVKIYDARLHRREAATILRARFEQAREFLDVHFLESRKKEGVDTSALTETLRRAYGQGDIHSLGQRETVSERLSSVQSTRLYRRKYPAPRQTGTG